MKSLLRLFLLVSLVVIGKLTKESSVLVDTAAKSARSALQAPVRSASYFIGQSIPKSAAPETDRNLWQTSSASTLTLK